jgi:hypothetical protein
MGAPTGGTVTIQELKNKVLEDGVVDEGEVTQLQTAIMADDKVDREEADVLFEINDKATSKCAGWNDLFVTAISNHVLQDDTSPGEIDEAEATWLIDKIKGDGQVDDLEKRLLTNIKTNATTVHEKLTTFFTEVGI